MECSKQHNGRKTCQYGTAGALDGDAFLASNMCMCCKSLWTVTRVRVEDCWHCISIHGSNFLLGDWVIGPMAPRRNAAAASGAAEKKPRKSSGEASSKTYGMGASS